MKVVIKPETIEIVSQLAPKYENKLRTLHIKPAKRPIK